MLLRGGIGAHQAEDPVGVIRVRRPDLLAVDDVVVAVACRAGLQRSEVGAGIRLGIALAPADQPCCDLRQMLLLLRLGAVFEQRRPEHGDAERGQAAAARRSRPSPDARSWPPRRRGRRRHIPSANAARSSPCRACARTRRAAGRRRIWRCARPRRCRLRQPCGLRISGGQFCLQPCAGFFAEFFQIGHRYISTVKIVATDLSGAQRISICSMQMPPMSPLPRDRLYRSGGND